MQMAERRARCGAKDRPDGARASVWADVATEVGTHWARLGAA